MWGAAFVAAAVLGTLASCSGSRDFPDKPNILLITVDTLRADHLSSYGYHRATSPVLDRLAAEGVRFDQASVQWPKTGPSFASMFTATYPKDNGIVRRIGVPLPDEFPMLAELLRQQGYTTHAVVANGAVGSDFNFDQGFDTYIETWKLPALKEGDDPNGAEAVTRLAMSVADKIPADSPYFLWVHYIDPHFPYSPPGEWAHRFQQDEHFDPSRKLRIDWQKTKRDVTAIGRDQVLEGRDDLAFYVARYDAEIAYADFHLGVLREYLESKGLLERTLTVFTSDHGESLGDHEYYFDHGKLGFQTCLRVPLLFHFAGVLGPAVDRDPAELIALMPTLLEIAGLDLDEGRWMQSRSLVPRLLGERLEPDEPVFVFSEAGYGRNDMWQRIVRDRRYKFVDAQEGAAQHWITGAVGTRHALYDLLEDPEEKENILQDRLAVAERLRQVVTRWYETPFELVQEAADESGEMSDATREQLKALGYLD
jgi:arylsulfatase A-like enzyme